MVPEMFIFVSLLLKNSFYLMELPNDTYRHKGLRKKLVEEVRSKGIHHQMVLDALEAVPRHFFLDSSFLEMAYQDKAFPIGSGQTISQPYTVAFQTDLLEVQKGDRILEVGTGSGYQACILAQMGARVFSIERHLSLYRKTKALLDLMGYRVKLFYGDGYKGLPAFSPFHSILLTAAPPEVPGVLLAQLRTGGRLVVPLGKGNTQVMTRITKEAEGVYREEQFGYFRFVPMLGDKAP